MAAAGLAISMPVALGPPKVVESFLFGMKLSHLPSVGKVIVLAETEPMIPGLAEKVWAASRKESRVSARWFLSCSLWKAIRYEDILQASRKTHGDSLPAITPLASFYVIS
jgi:hypothetical protein